MKKLMIMAVVLTTAIASQAASVAWKSNALSFGDTALKSSTTVSGYLVLLSGTSLASYTLDDDFDASKVGVIKNSDTDGTSKGSLINGTLDCSDASNGNAYALLSKYVDATGDIYWNLSSTIRTLSGLDPNDPRVNPSAWESFGFSSTVVGESTTLTAGAGWTKAKPVPEPATGALALAGIALLFRRRKA